MRSLLVLFISILCFEGVLADDGYHRRTEGEYVGLSCTYAMTKTAVFCSKGKDKTSCQCTNADSLGSILYCAYKEVSSKKQKDDFNEWFLKSCPKLTDEKLELAYANATKYLMSPSDIPNFNKTLPVHVPVKYSKKVYGYALHTYHIRYHNFDYAMAMGGGGLIGYWALIILIGTVNNIFEKLFPRQLLAINKRLSNNFVVKAFRKHVIVPALFRKQHTERNFIMGVIPTRIQSLVIFGFVIMMFVFSGVRYVYIEHNISWPRKKVQIARYVGDRTAVLSMFCIPITYLFAGRNNFLLWMTGWKQSTFYIYHKWMARITVLISVAHSISMFADSIWMDKLKTRKLTVWYRAGCFGMIAMSIMFILSIGWIRAYQYELFLNMHIGLAIIAMAGVWHHAANFEYMQYCYAAIAVWAFDRFVRICRLCCFGVKKANVTIVSGEILKVRVPKPSWWPTFPGAYGYIHFLESSCFWQSHPFTIVKANDNEITFCIKIKKGVTETIYKKLLDKPNMTDEIKVSIEGPYGDHKHLGVYDNAIFFASSNGIPSLFCYARELSKLQNETGKKTFVKFYWVIRHWHSLDWFMDELKEMAQFDNVEPIVYITKYQDGKVGEKFLTSSSSETSDSDEKHSYVERTWLENVVAAFPHILFKEGRPNIQELIKSDLSSSANQNVAVMTCAHNTMSDDIRKVVADEIPNFNGRLDLFEELQVW